ncbi:flagellar protein FlaG [Maricaulis sp. CAU 1757]
MAAPIDQREISSDRPREGVRRVEPVQGQDGSAALHDRQTDRSQDIERLAAQTLRNSRLKIEQDQSSGTFVYFLIDQDTGETVRRWPPEKYGELMEFLRTQRAGLLDKSA